MSLSPKRAAPGWPDCSDVAGRGRGVQRACAGARRGNEGEHDYAVVAEAIQAVVAAQGE